MAALSDFYPELQLEMAGAPVPLLDEAVRKGCIRAANHSGLVRETLASVLFSANTRSVSLVPSDAETEVAGVIFVKINNTDLSPKAPSSLILEGSERGDPKVYLFEAKLLYVYPVPTADVTATVRVELRPKRAAATIPDKILDDNDLYNAALAEAKRYLSAQVGKPWSMPPQQVKAFEDEFYRHADEAKIRAIRGDSGADLTVIQTAFGGGSNGRGPSFFNVN